MVLSSRASRHSRAIMNFGQIPPSRRALGVRDIMAWGVPDYRSAFRVLRKREAQLKHAIKNDHSYEKLVRAAERLRDAKLKTFKSEFVRGPLPLSSYVPDAKAARWQSMSVDDIIDIYSK